MALTDNPFVGSWSYRSFLNDPDLNVPFNDLEFGKGTIVIEEAPFEELRGTIGGPGWSLALHGSRGYGTPMALRFQGKGVVDTENWVYDYIGWLVPSWPNSDTGQQRPAIVGSVGTHDSAWNRTSWRSRFVLRGPRGLNAVGVGDLEVGWPALALDHAAGRDSEKSTILPWH